MKRLHIHIRTKKLEQSVSYYTALFGQAPTVSKPDYAKWQLDDPAANIALSTHGRKTGIHHVGIAFDDDDDRRAVDDRLTGIDPARFQQQSTTCCYAQSHKTWTRDPQGAIWELFHSFGDSATYSQIQLASEDELPPTSPCCARPANAEPRSQQTRACCS